MSVEEVRRWLQWARLKPPTWPVLARQGRLSQIRANAWSVTGLQAPIGAVCQARALDGRLHKAQITELRGDVSILAPLGDAVGLTCGCLVTVISQGWKIGLGPDILGRVLDGHGFPLDGRAGWSVEEWRGLDAEPPAALSRPLIRHRVETGVRALDGLMTLGKGQRIGIMAQAGVGKSTLLGMLGRSAGFDTVVVALIGERGREVREFLELALGERGRRRSVVICATSDSSAQARIHAAHLATTIAEYFRDRRQSVLLMMDSLTRYARALRERALAAGELPARRGYPASVFAQLPGLLERAGTSTKGSITALYTLLAEDAAGDDPITEEVRGILDGHILMSRSLAAQGHYPAIDLLNSISRVMPQVAETEHLARARQFRSQWAKYQEIELLLQVGEYQEGQDAIADLAIKNRPAMQSFLQQAAHEFVDWGQMQAELSSPFVP